MSLVNEMLYFLQPTSETFFLFVKYDLTGLILGKDNIYPKLTILYYANRHDGK